MDKFVLIDGNSLINRAFYATPPLSSPSGEPTNAVYAFMNMLIKIINEVSPKYILVAFDVHAPTFRHKIFADYKAGRKPMPDDLRPQIPLLKKVLDSIGICHYECAGIEADDIIGTLSKKYNIQTIIYTGDRDSLQLVDESTSVYFTKRGITDILEYNNQNFITLTGITPPQIVDLKSLMGDSSDNIPGVKGVGEKTAISLIQTYLTTDGVYENIDSIQGKLKGKLIEGLESAKLSKTLATINTSVDIPFELNNFEFNYPFSEDSKELFAQLGFVNILKKEGVFIADNKSTISECQIVNYNESLFSLSNIKNDKIIVNISENISFYIFDNNEYIVPIKESFFDEGYYYDDAIKLFKPIFEDENKTVIVYKKNMLCHKLDELNIGHKCKFEDVSILKYLVDYTGKDEDLSTAILANNLFSDMKSYSLSLLFDRYQNLLDNDSKKLYYDMELPLSNVLYDMECTGFKVDIDTLNMMSQEYNNELNEIAEKIYQIAGYRFNVNSTKQLAELLFDKLKLDHGKKTKSGYSTNSDVLEQLENEHEIIPLILKYRKIAKLNSTYIDGFRDVIDKSTGLVHTTFNQVQTATGRLSSREPNLQNIPVRDDFGKEVRKLFSARSNDRILVDADYSQIELRLLADFAKCQPLIDAFNSERDIHAETASRVFNVPIENVTKDMRRSAKAVNFGVIYGISEYGLAKNLKITPKEASIFIQKYFELYPEVKNYMENNKEFAHKTGYATTIFGRKRFIKEINSSNFNLRSFGERVAMNMPLQGSAADIMKIAMINVYNKLKDNNLKSKLILQVHDELIIDAYVNELDIVKDILVNEMQNAVKLSVPLTVDCNCCYNWFDAK